MKLEYNHFLPADFDPSSRVWIYQASRLFTLSEAIEIEGLLATFAENWISHGDKVKGYAKLFFGQFIVLMADETATGVGGRHGDQGPSGERRASGDPVHGRRPASTPDGVARLEVLRAKEPLDRLAVLTRQAQDRKALVGPSFRKGIDVRNALEARPTPSRPEFHHHHLAPQSS